MVKGSEYRVIPNQRKDTKFDNLLLYGEEEQYR